MHGSYIKNIMTKYIAILRGINVGGKRKILMTDLKQLFENLGYIDVVSYIQSGNVIFNNPHNHSSIEIEDAIHKAISDQYSFDVPVIVRTASEIQAAVKSNPYYSSQELDINQLHLTFLKEKPAVGDIEKAETYQEQADSFVVVEKDVFVFCQGKYHQSKFSNNFFESKLKVRATTRNWKTVLKLLELSC